MHGVREGKWDHFTPPHCFSRYLNNSTCYRSICHTPGARERLTLCEVQVFDDSLTYTCTSEALYADISDDLFDKNEDTCIAKNRMRPGKVATIGNLKIFTDKIKIDNITVALKGRFDDCNQTRVAYVERNDPSSQCDYVQACLPDVTRNVRLVESGSCFLTCKCNGVSCTIKIIPWLGDGKGGVEQVCEVMAFTYNDIPLIPNGFY